MGECICVTCKNLKSNVNEEGEPGEYTCQFGFPSQTCEENCQEENCELTCIHFISEDEKDEPRVVNCSKCGKALKQVCSDGEVGNSYCINCFLEKD